MSCKTRYKTKRQNLKIPTHPGYGSNFLSVRSQGNCKYEHLLIVALGKIPQMFMVHEQFPKEIHLTAKYYFSFAIFIKILEATVKERKFSEL